MFNWWEKTTTKNHKVVAEVLLLDAQQSIGSGQWLLVIGLDKISVHFDGIVNATCQLRGSNSLNEPTNNGVRLGPDVTEDTIIHYVDVPLKWIRASVTGYVSGSISVYLLGE